jgi:CheY-like chemotaxis protein
MDQTMSTNRKTAYAVEVIGFNQTERIVLASIFGLSARREPKFLQHTSVAFAPDLYLIDASDSQAVALFKARNSAMTIPGIFIGDTSHGTQCPVLARPLQWTKLFRAFDQAISQAAAQAATAPPPPPSIPAHVQPARETPSLAPTLNLESTQPLPAMPEALAPIAAPVPPRAPAYVPTPPPAPTVAPAPAPAPTIARAPNGIPLHAAPIVPRAAPVATVMPMPATPTTPPKSVQRNLTIPPVAAPAARNDADWVLVVDDNLTVREFMKSKLAPFNFNVDYASSGEEAVGFTGSKHYTCVFLDVIMPGIDGYQVCKLIKSKRAAAKTAVVMLTSKGSPFDKIRGAMAGCDAYLTKPVDEDKLLQTIVRFLPTH